jgi:hypothetical protein
MRTEDSEEHKSLLIQSKKNASLIWEGRNDWQIYDMFYKGIEYL